MQRITVSGLPKAIASMLSVSSLVAAASMAQTVDDVALPVREALEEGRLLFENLDPSAAIERFTEVIDSLQPVADASELSEAQRDVYLESLSYRARSAFSIGRTGIVSNDLDLAIRLDPSFDCRDRLVSPVLIDQCDGRRAQLVGVLDLRVAPMDAEIQIDGRAVDADVGSIEILAGPHVILVNRAGYEGVSESVDVSAGARPTVYEIELARVSAVLRVVTRPPGATVHVDTVPHGPTEGTAALDPSRPPVLDGYPLREFSAEIVVPNLSPGSVSVVVTMEGYRTIRAELDLPEAADYPYHFVLERAEGTVVFDGLPEGSVVELRRRGDETPVPPVVGTGPATLPIGVYEVSVSHPTAGFFESTATVVDREEYRVPVRLRPRAVLVGVLGEDEVGRGLLIRTLGRAFDGIDGWTFRNGLAEGTAAVVRAGLTASRLREYVNPLIARSGSPDWERMQIEADQAVRSSVSMVGVLDSDASSRYADLWVWRSAPGSARPGRLRVSLTESESTASETAVAAAFADVSLERLSLGASLIETEAEGGPVLISVIDGGPADEAGLIAGDVLVSVGGVDIQWVRDVNAWLSGAAAGEPVEIVFRRGDTTHRAELIPVLGPATVVERDPTLVYPALATRLLATAGGPDARQPEWVWRLGQAAIALDIGDVDAAVSTLQQLEDASPAGPGIGRGTVQYWLGLAYLAAGPEFRDQARGAFELAAADSRARLWNDDGPWVAPRARARLAQLDAGASLGR